MDFRLFRLSLMISVACCATPAIAADLSAEVGLVSDYRYRGFSLSGGKPVAQASVTIEHESGAYAFIWTSTIDDGETDGNVELDLVGGYAFDLDERLSLDLSLTYYLYPSDSDSNYLEATAILERESGPTTLKAGFSLAPKQHGTRDEWGGKHRNSYLFAGASHRLEQLPVTISAEIGHERGLFDEVEGGGKWDWCLGAGVALEPFRLGLNYSGSDAGGDALVASFFVDL